MQKKRALAAATLAAALFALATAGLLPSDAPAFRAAHAGAGCAPAPEHLATAGDGGIGGTGRADEGENGGTGGIGGTGIVGTITGFASVCVNGVEVFYGEAVPVAENGRPASVHALAVGQVVAIDAAPGAQGLTARRIEIVHALEGPVTGRSAGRLEVMGTAVVPADAAARRAAEAARPGDWVQVSGHRDGAGRWVATRLARVEPRREAVVLGQVDAAGRIAGVRVEAAVGAVGDVRLVRGEWLPAPDGAAGGRLRAREAGAAPADRVLAGVGRLFVETRVREVKDGRVRTGHPELDAALAGQTLRAGELVRVRAHREAGGRIVADRVERAASGGRGAGAPSPAGEHPASRSAGKGAGNDDRDGRGRDEADRGDRSDHGGRGERAERPERSERSGRGDRHGRD